MSDFSTEVHALTDEYVRRLVELHDEYGASSELWHLVLVRVSRYGDKVNIRNPVTGSVIDDERALAAKSRSALRRSTVRSFKDLVTQFELFLADLLRLWLPLHPEQVQDKAIDVATLLQCTTLEQAKSLAIAEAIESLILKKMYERPIKWFNFLHHTIHVRTEPADQNAFIEMKARRDVLEHLNGVADAGYTDKAGPAAKYRTSDHIEVMDADVDEAYRLVRKLIEAVGNSVASQPHAPTKVNP